ncbi:MAG: hypothetical protein V6Z89_23080 [Desulfobacter sp.]
MKLNHALLCLLSPFLFVAIISTMAVSGPLGPSSVPDKLIGVIIGEPLNNNSLGDLIQEIRSITEIRNDNCCLRLRVTGVYNAISASKNSTRVPSVEFLPMFGLTPASGGPEPVKAYVGQRVVIKPVTVNSYGAFNLAYTSRWDVMELRVFELDLSFDSRTDGYTESIYFPIKQKEGEYVVLTVTWNNGTWEYHYNL